MSVHVTPGMDVVALDRAGERQAGDACASRAWRRSAQSGQVALQLPDGWTAEPQPVPFSVEQAGQSATVGFTLKRQPAVREPGTYVFTARATVAGPAPVRVVAPDDCVSAHPDTSPVRAGALRPAPRGRAGRAGDGRLHHGHRRRGAGRAEAARRAGHPARRPTTSRRAISSSFDTIMVGSAPRKSGRISWPITAGCSTTCAMAAR